MNDLNARIAEKLKDRSVEKKYLRAAVLYRLAAALLLLRKQRGLTQKELAEKVGTTQTVISRLESASVKPSLETILKVAEALDAAVDVRLLPVESMRRGEESVDAEAETRKLDPLKGIIYYDWEHSTLSTDAKWISTPSSPIENVSEKKTARPLSSKSKIREYA